MMKAKVKIYACSYTDRLATNPLEFVDIAIDEGVVCNFENYIADEYTAKELIDYFSNNDSSMTIGEALAILHNDYNKYLEEEMEELFDSCDRNWWWDEVEVEVKAVN